MINIAKIKSHIQDHAPEYIVAATTVATFAIVVYLTKKTEIDPAHNLVIPDEWLQRMNETGEALLLTTNIGDYILKKTNI